MRAELFTIDRPGAGRLSTMTKPGGGEGLAIEMSALAAAGITVLVSLLTDGEMAEAGLTGEAEAAAAAGLEFLRLPTPDQTVPNQQAALAIAGMLRSRLAAGGGVAVHCYAGIGRCSTLAAAVLVMEGMPAADAWTRLTAARGVPVPDNPAQRAFVDGLPAA